MYEYINGTLEEQEDGYIVIDNNGIGYRVTVSLNTLAEMPHLHESVRVLLHPVFQEREGIVVLYGFATEEERKLFRTLIGVSGVGPKAAMGLLSQYDYNELTVHIVNGDAKAISRAPGIGKKTAERIVVDLKDKFKDVVIEAGDGGSGASARLRAQDNLFNEAVNGLLGLGYSYNEAAGLVEKVMKPDMTIEEILQQSLMNAAK